MAIGVLGPWALGFQGAVLRLWGNVHWDLGAMGTGVLGPWPLGFCSNVHWGYGAMAIGVMGPLGFWAMGTGVWGWAGPRCLPLALPLRGHRDPRAL